MGTQADERIPSLTLGWRLRMAMEDAEVTRAEMAEQLGVDPATITRWSHDKGQPPKRAYLLQWALVTNVSPVWLASGVGSSGGAPDPAERGVTSGYHELSAA